MWWATIVGQKWLERCTAICVLAAKVQPTTHYLLGPFARSWRHLMRYGRMLLLIVSGDSRATNTQRLGACFAMRPGTTISFLCLPFMH